MGYAKVLYEESLTPESLLRHISDVHDRRGEMMHRMSDNPFGNGTDVIVQLIEKYRRPGI
jgi:UDP-N-acetylglucosamine--N-acetylmuramyl-(pentapeptide) pyrophosphoryl-undecaprenol N-acetylglucosamine transferase